MLEYVYAERARNHIHALDESPLLRFPGRNVPTTLFYVLTLGIGDSASALMACYYDITRSLMIQYALDLCNGTCGTTFLSDIMKPVSARYDDHHPNRWKAQSACPTNFFSLSRAGAMILELRENID